MICISKTNVLKPIGIISFGIFSFPSTLTPNRIGNVFTPYSESFFISFKCPRIAVFIHNWKKPSVLSI